MALFGEIVTLFKDKAKQNPIFPKTKINAISDNNGNGLDQIITEITQNIDINKANSQVFTATFRVDAWQNSGTSFTQSAPCIGMKESYSTGVPWFYKTENDVTNAELQRMLNVLTSGVMTTENDNITATITKQPTCDIQIYLRRINTV